ncbi:hypothetical protein SBRCBS47491_005770 [Sporothrix bragantina]|uniref:Uncharacterized protein n=1 Tax=Sporothrix bragantina TaxID=671064 RepID=A0ABP0C1L8_9PEZI
MPQDPDLYGQRTAKKKKTELGLSNTLDFTSHMQSLIKAKPSSSASSSRSGEKRSSTSLFSSLPNKKSKTSDDKKEKSAKSKSKSKASKAPWAKRPAQGTADAELDAHEREQIRRNMAAKAKRYAEMQRGDYIPREGEVQSLVDFDRKWAERRTNGDASESDHSSDSEDNQNKEMVEYVDEFGRTRTVSKARRERDLRREERAARAAQDLEEMRARPAPPPDSSRLLYGDVIQTEAIEAAVDRPAPWGGGDGDGDAEQPTHYRAQDDVRTRGAAFYAFATNDEEKRAAQMQALADERTKTESARAERSALLDARKQEMAARRAALAERKARKQADSFLDGLGKDLFSGGGDDE